MQNSYCKRDKNASEKTKNSRGRIGAAHFVVAFLKSHPKPEAGPYDIRTIVFEQGNLEV